MVMAMLVEQMQAHPQAGLGGVGIDELRWLKPVYPGDVLSCESEFLEKTPSRSKPHMGSGRIRVTALNQHDEPVMSYVNIFLIAVRDPVAAEG
jgi:acyl dehydratase